MTSNRVFVVLRRVLAVAAVGFAMVVAMLFAANSKGFGPASLTMSAVNLSMFKSFTAFKQWLAAVPYYYYVFIGLGLLVLAIITTAIAIFKRGRIKRNNVSVLMMVGDADEEVDATIFKEHFAVVIVARPTNILPTSDNVIESPFPIGSDLKYSSSQFKNPVAVERDVLVGDERLDENLDGSATTLSESIVSAPANVNAAVFRTSKMIRGTAARENVILVNENKDEIVPSKVEQNIAQSINQTPSEEMMPNEVEQNIVRSINQTPCFITALQQDRTLSSGEYKAYNEPAASVIDNISEPLFCDGGYIIYDDEVPVSDKFDDFGEKSLLPYTLLDEKLESYYQSEPTIYIDTEQLYSAEVDEQESTEVDEQESAEVPIENEVVYNPTTEPIEELVDDQFEFTCVEIEDDAPQVVLPIYTPETTLDYEIFDNNNNIIGEQHNEVLFDIVDEYSDVAAATISYDDNEVERFEPLESFASSEIDEQIDEDLMNKTAEETISNIDEQIDEDMMNEIAEESINNINEQIDEDMMNEIAEETINNIDDQIEEDAANEIAEDTINNDEQIEEDAVNETTEDTINNDEQIEEDVVNETTEDAINNDDQIEEDLVSETAEDSINNDDQIEEDVANETAEDAINNDEQIEEDVANETDEETINNVDGMGVDDAVLMAIPQKKNEINTEDNAYKLLDVKDATEDAIESSNNGTVIVDGDGDGVVDEVLVDKDILKVRYKTVDMDKRLRRASEDTKAFYSELKNCLLSHGGVKSRLSKRFDSFTVGRFVTAKIAIRGNIINLYLALPGERVDEKYFAENVGDSETYGKTPTLHKVKSRRGCKYGLDLIVELMTDLNLSVVEGYEHIDYVAMYPAENIEEKKAEIAHLFRSSISIGELEDMTDEEAIEYIEIVKSKEYTINKFNPINKYVIFLDDIASLYESGDTVTIADLIEKAAIPDESNIYLEVRGRGVLDKKLFIEAHSFDLQAVKMIILTDGYVTQYK